MLPNAEEIAEAEKVLGQAANLLEGWAGKATEGSREVVTLEPNENRRHRLWWVKARYKDENSSGVATVAECLWREGDARLAAVVSPDFAVQMAGSFRAWAHMVHYDPSLICRVGGPETLTMARMVCDILKEES